MTNHKPHSEERPLIARSFWMPREHDDALRILARRNQRTLSGELRLVVEKHLAANGIELDEAA